MKLFIKITACILFTGSMSVFSCKKENTTTAVNNTSTQNSLAPVANAGADQTVNIISCYVGRTVELDGSASLNDNTGLLEFSWAKVSGPFCNISSMGTNSPKAEVTQLSAGQYAFELTVTGQPTASSKGLSARDTMLVTVTGTTAATEYNLDVTFNNAFQFSRNVERCYTWYMGPLICSYWDLTNVNGSFSLPTLGEVIFSAYEQADTTSSGVYTNTQMSFSCAGCVPSEYAEGTSSINFKQLIRQGGGPFNGILQIQNGSAKNNCDSHVFDNVDPLVISGNMDTEAHTINLSIKGKVFF